MGPVRRLREAGHGPADTDWIDPAAVRAIGSPPLATTCGRSISSYVCPMTAIRSFLLEALQRVVDGGDIEHEELDAAVPNPLTLDPRSEERRVGKEWASTCRARW